MNDVTVLSLSGTVSDNNDSQIRLEGKARSQDLPVIPVLKVRAEVQEWITHTHTSGHLEKLYANQRACYFLCVGVPDIDVFNNATGQGYETAMSDDRTGSRSSAGQVTVAATTASWYCSEEVSCSSPRVNLNSTQGLLQARRRREDVHCNNQDPWQCLWFVLVLNIHTVYTKYIDSNTVYVSVDI